MNLNYDRPKQVTQKRTSSGFKRLSTCHMLPLAEVEHFEQMNEFRTERNVLLGEESNSLIIEKRAPCLDIMTLRLR